METERRRVDWVILILAVMVVSSPAASLIAADWTDGMEVLLTAGLLGVLVGLVISISHFRGLTSHLLSAVYSIFWLGYVFAGPLPYESWRDRIVMLIVRINGWFALTFRGGTGRDSVLFVLVLSLLFWWLGYIAIWNLVRHQRIWRALLPPVVPLIINTYYYVGPSRLAPYLMLYLLCALLIIARSYTVIQERRWDSERIGYNSDVRFDLLRSGVVLATVAIVLAWVAPTAATSEQAYEVWRRVEGPWRGVEENFNRMFSTLRSQARSYGNPFGRMITLRGPRLLTDTPVLDVAAPPDKRFYWRGVVYDRYTGSSWINSDSDSVQLEAWSEPSLETYSAREIVTQTFLLNLPVDTLIFAAPQPVRVSVATRADVRINSSGVEVSQLISARTMRKGASYQVISSLSIAETEKLRTAGTTYPPSIRDRYLQLPDSLPPSVRTQARTIAGNLDTPYDKASAIEAWLRANVVYDDKTPAPAEDQDGVAYLLSVRRGYCDYYASAMVVMLRTLGVPARVAVGYAQGRYDAAAGVYHVTEKDSHSWVEVFFPQYGWVEFEPTASQPAVERPTPQPQVATPTPGSEDDPTKPKPTPRNGNEPEEGDQPFGAGGSANRTTGLLGGWLVGLAILGVALALAAALLWVFERRRPRRGLPVVRSRRRLFLGLGLAEAVIAVAFAVMWIINQRGLSAVLMSGWLWGLGIVVALVVGTLAAMRIFERRGLGGLSLTAQVYARLMRFSGWLEVQWRESQTPHERGAAFSDAAPAAENLIVRIVDDYTREQYSPNPPSGADLEQVWRSLSPQLWLAGLRLRIQRSLLPLRDLRARQQSLMRRLNRQFS